MSSGGGVTASVDVGVAQEDVGRVVKKQKMCARASNEVLERAIEQVRKEECGVWKKSVVEEKGQSWFGFGGWSGWLKDQLGG